MKKRLLTAFLAGLMLASSACAALPADIAQPRLSQGEELIPLDTSGGYLSPLSGDAKLDNEIWAYAEECYNDWKTRYDAILAKGDAKADIIEEIPEEYSLRIEAATNVGKPFLGYSSRLVSTLKDYTDTEEPRKDIYGGFMIESMKQEATGFFYTKKLDDRWWFIDPLGYPCYITSVGSMTYAYGNSDAHSSSMIKKYGSQEKWAIAATKELKDLGFNTRGSHDRSNSWLTDVEEELNYQTTIAFLNGYEIEIGTKDTVTQSGSTLLTAGMHVFDPGFVDYCDAKAEKTLVGNKIVNDPYLIGYTTDNELPIKDNKMGLELNLKLDVKTDSVHYYSYATAWTFLAKESGKDDPGLSDVTNNMKERFRAFVYDRYFGVVTTAIRKYDPNHMILGSRALYDTLSAEGVCRVLGYWLDCLTFNWYYEWKPDTYKLRNVSKWADKPFMITEFYAKAEENEGGLGNAKGAGFFVKTQEERGIFYETYTLRLLECKNVVGWHWFMYIDESPDAVSGGAKNAANKGLYTNTHEVYEDLAEHMTAVNHNIYSLITHFDAE